MALLCCLAAPLILDTYSTEELEDRLYRALNSTVPEEKITAYEEALFLTKIIEGMESPNQLPLIKALIELQEDSEDLRYLKAHVTRRVYGRVSAEAIEAIDSLARWKLENATDYRDLTTAEQLYNIAGMEGEVRLQALLGASNAKVVILQFLVEAPLSFFASSSDISVSIDRKRLEIYRSSISLRRSMREVEALIEKGNYSFEEYNRIVILINEALKGQGCGDTRILSNMCGR
jgi:hypothetical protein